MANINGHPFNVDNIDPGKASDNHKRYRDAGSGRDDRLKVATAYHSQRQAKVCGSD
jgi:hypothetical protein